MINEKQMELSKMLFERLKKKFPEIELVSITESAESPFNIWVNIIYPQDEDRQIEMHELASKISTDILLDFGYHITISYATAEEKETA